MSILDIFKKKDMELEARKQYLEKYGKAVVSYVVDCSPSMGSPTNDRKSRESRSEAVIRTVGKAIKMYPDTPVELIGFSGHAEKVTNVEDLHVHRGLGGTNIQSGLRKVDHAGSVAILLTDGEENGGSAEAEIPRLQADRITVHAIGVGVNAGTREMLQKVAFETGGVYMDLESDSRQIEMGIAQLAERAVTQLKATAPRKAIAMNSGS